jgi:hypothetical protein
MSHDDRIGILECFSGQSTWRYVNGSVYTRINQLVLRKRIYICGQGLTLTLTNVGYHGEKYTTDIPDLDTFSIPLQISPRCDITVLPKL